VEGDVVEVGDDLVDGGRGGAVEEDWSVGMHWGDGLLYIIQARHTPARSGP
jgi:hypothetical protein